MFEKSKFHDLLDCYFVALTPLRRVNVFAGPGAMQVLVNPFSNGHLYDSDEITPLSGYKMLSFVRLNSANMSTLEIRTELKKMIEQEKDVRVLEAIHTILLKTGLNVSLKEKLTARALKSEKDIKAGRLFSRDEVAKRTARR